MEETDFKNHLNGHRVADILTNCIEQKFDEMPLYKLLVEALDASEERE